MRTCIKTSQIEDIYWRGITYHDICRAEKSLESRTEKEKIKEQLMQKHRYKNSFVANGKAPLPK